VLIILAKVTYTILVKSNAWYSLGKDTLDTLFHIFLSYLLWL